MIRILVADDHAVVRQGVKQILADVSDMVVKDEAQNSSETLEKVLQHDYDVVLLDISMPGRSGLEVLEDIKNQRPKLAVLILSMHPEEQYAIRALRSGASGYLTKASAPQELIGAIRKVAGGGKYVTSSLAEKLADELEIDTENQPHELLSNREHQVIAQPQIDGEFGRILDVVHDVPVVPSYATAGDGGTDAGFATGDLTQQDTSRAKPRRCTVDGAGIVEPGSRQ